MHRLRGSLGYQIRRDAVRVTPAHTATCVCLLFGSRWPRPDRVGGAQMSRGVVRSPTIEREHGEHAFRARAIPASSSPSHSVCFWRRMRGFELTWRWTNPYAPTGEILTADCRGRASPRRGPVHRRGLLGLFCRARRSRHARLQRRVSEPAPSCSTPRLLHYSWRSDCRARAPAGRLGSASAELRRGNHLLHGTSVRGSSACSEAGGPYPPSSA